MSSLQYTKSDCVGVDEVGRGCMFLDVVAGAVILPDEEKEWMKDIKDSKKISAKKRETLAEKIKEECIWGIGQVSAQEIDRMNILQASQKAMHIALQEVYDKKEFDNIIVDGTYFRSFKVEGTAGYIRHKCIPQGDSKYVAIAAASIIAKVYRDKLIEKACQDEPELQEKYSMLNHKGYCTKKHLEGLEKYGVHVNHRKSYAPVAKYLFKDLDSHIE